MISHIAIIPDGSRRYSKKYKISLKESYQLGIDQLFKISKYFFENGYGVDEISYFGFSENNWKREKSQIELLHNLFLKNAKQFFRRKNELKNIQIRFFGDLSKFNKSLIEALLKVSKNTVGGRGQGKKIINIGLNYSFENEINDILDKMNINSFENFKNNLQVKNNIDLVVRTGKHQRISGFLPIQSRNAEFYFTEKLWGELNEKEIKKIIHWYNRQKFNYGK